MSPEGLVGSGGGQLPLSSLAGLGLQNLSGINFPLNLPTLGNLPSFALPVPGLPQLPVPHDLSRFVSMLSGAAAANNFRKTDSKEESSSSSRSSSTGGMAQNLSHSHNYNNHGHHHHSGQPHHHHHLNVHRGSSARSMAKVAATAGIKRKKEECDAYSNAPPTRRSLRPRIERSYGR